MARSRRLGGRVPLSSGRFEALGKEKGQILLDLRRPREAVAAFDAALGLNSVDADTWCDAALAWRALGQESRAQKMLDRALNLDPANGRAVRLRSEATAST